MAAPWRGKVCAHHCRGEGVGVVAGRGEATKLSGRPRHVPPQATLHPALLLQRGPPHPVAGLDSPASAPSHQALQPDAHAPQSFQACPLSPTTAYSTLPSLPDIAQPSSNPSFYGNLVSNPPWLPAALSTDPWPLGLAFKATWLWPHL